MFSQNRKDDKVFLLELIEMIQLLAKIGTTQALDLAQKFGVDYLKLEQKIKCYDYTQDDYHWHGIIGRQKDEELLNENK